MNFGGDEVVYDYSESGIIIVPVPYDETSSWMRGADKGPEAILEASVNLEFFDVETASEAHLNGIYTMNPIIQKESPENLVEDVYYRILSLLADNKFPVLIGGIILLQSEQLRPFLNILIICLFFNSMLIVISGRYMRVRN